MRLASAGLSLIILAAMFMPLERAFPARVGQPILRPAVWVDVCFFLGQYWLFASFAVALMDGVQWGILPEITWMAARSPLLQLVVAVVLGDLVVYWLHRAFHQFSWLWRFHAVHHSATELDWMAAFREHPVDGMVTQLVINLPAMLLGVRTELLAYAFVFRGAWAIFVHCNVRVPLGPLRVLFGAPELHRWHHARVQRTAHNFANLAPYLDRLFGTYHCPPGDDYALGLVDPGPRSYLGLLLRPLLPRSIG